VIEALEQPRRGRPPKQIAEGEAVETATRRERRRKDGDSENAGLRLAIPEWVYEKYPRNEFKLAWIIDDPARLHQKHGEDWDVVENVTRVPGATDKHGNPTDMILHVKRLEWDREDKARLETRRREIERQAEGGKVSGLGDDAGQTLSEKHSYADGANRLR
jgi:hypothetical protein